MEAILEIARSNMNEWCKTFKQSWTTKCLPLSLTTTLYHHKPVIRQNFSKRSIPDKSDIWPTYLQSKVKHLFWDETELSLYTTDMAMLSVMCINLLLLHLLSTALLQFLSIVQYSFHLISLVEYIQILKAFWIKVWKRH